MSTECVSFYFSQYFSFFLFVLSPFRDAETGLLTSRNPCVLNQRQQGRLRVGRRARRRPYLETFPPPQPADSAPAPRKPSRHGPRSTPHQRRRPRSREARKGKLGTGNLATVGPAARTSGRPYLLRSSEATLRQSNRKQKSGYWRQTSRPTSSRSRRFSFSPAVRTRDSISGRAAGPTPADLPTSRPTARRRTHIAAHRRTAAAAAAASRSRPRPRPAGPRACAATAPVGLLKASAPAASSAPCSSAALGLPWRTRLQPAPAALGSRAAT